MQAPQPPLPPANARRFLFLQGPHGPFFDQLGALLRRAGAETFRVGFNRGDQLFWSDRGSFIAHDGDLDEWAGACDGLMDTHAITDLVLYGDTRPVHATAIIAARTRGIAVHVFEEGYLRPYWVTYERGGSNGNSPIVGKSLDEMRRDLAAWDTDIPTPPAHWGDMRQHVFYGALYHFFVMVMNGRYARVTPHRQVTVATEFRFYLNRLARTPLIAANRFAATRRVMRGGFPYHLVLLQLEHDASFRVHGPFATMEDFLKLCLEEFATGAPRHHHLVFKAHPLEDGRARIRHSIQRHAARLNLTDRVHFVDGGKMARLLDLARSVVTVNSTAAQQALWRGLPVKSFGQSVYARPEFTSDLPLHRFFADPPRPDVEAYRVYRHYLLATSQVPGGFYSAGGRRRLMHQVADLILSPDDPYTALSEGRAAQRQQLRLVARGA